MNVMNGVQRLGRTLMLPIAVLPVAGLLLRFGQPDLLDIPFVAAAGASIFSNLGLLFAIGVAVGFAKENHGAAGLAGLVGYLVATQGAQTLLAVPPEILSVLSEDARDLAATAFREKEIGKLSVPIGILSGVIAGFLYNKYGDIKLPEFLAFFGGRRFVPIAAGFAGVLVAFVFGMGWSYIEGGMDMFSRSVVGSGEIGLFVYGVLNRILIVTGLHHILNNVAWFIVGDFGGVTGDLNRFFAGDKTAGAFMAGFFPVMMFGLPAACFAMYRSAPPERRNEVGGMYLSLGLTSFLTGVTEPIEFTFIFLAPALYAVHAVLTGAAMALMDILGVKLGFGFSAGLIDYILNFNKSTKPLLLLPIGAAYALVYYAMFRTVIVMFDLKTPGRGDVIATASEAPQSDDGKARDFIAALGGPANVSLVEACTTRLRLLLQDDQAVDEGALARLGARGVIRPTKGALQVILGPIADQVAKEINAALKTMGDAAPAARRRGEAAGATDVAGQSEWTAAGLERLSCALGGLENIADVKSAASRLLVTLKKTAAVDETALKASGVRAVARSRDGRLHLIVGPGADAAALGLAMRLS